MQRIKEMRACPWQNIFDHPPHMDYGIGQIISCGFAQRTIKCIIPVAVRHILNVSSVVDRGLHKSLILADNEDASPDDLDTPSAEQQHGRLSVKGGTAAPASGGRQLWGMQRLSALAAGRVDAGGGRKS